MPLMRNVPQSQAAEDADCMQSACGRLSFQAPVKPLRSAAAVRSDTTVVYDLHRTIEESAGEGKPWLGRSFSVAEQFVLTRAGSVVVHREKLRQKSLEWGVAQENLFLIPYPLEPAWCESAAHRRWPAPRFASGPET